LRLVLCLAFLAVASASTPTSDWAKFNQYKLKFDKIYAPGDEAERFAVFQTNLARVDALNALQTRDQVYHYLTKFMDLTPDEFRATVLMNVTVPDQRPTRATNITAKARALPTNFDWSSTPGIVTPVKNQGQCGSCWDFSATETMESVCARAGYGLHVFSEQQTVDCDTNGQDQGCNGGWPEGAYAYIISAGGIESEANYPYTAEDGTCNFNSGELEACKITGWDWVIQHQNENHMQAFVHTTSPVSICVDASSWQYYSSGVLQASSCTTNIDHCVQVTGWSTMGGQLAWNVRNSWGASWGVNGYIYLQFGQDTCAMAQHVTIPCVTNSAGVVFPKDCKTPGM